MPPKKSKQANEEKLKVGQQAKLEKEAIAESDTALNNLQSSFRESKAYAIQLEQQLTEQVQICTDLQNKLNTSHDLINMLHNEILSLKSKNSDIYHQLCMYGMTMSQRRNLKVWLNGISNSSPEKSWCYIISLAFKGIEGFCRYYYKPFEDEWRPSDWVVTVWYNLVNSNGGLNRGCKIQAYFLWYKAEEGSKRNLQTPKRIPSGYTSQGTCRWNSKGQGHSTKISSPSFTQRHFQGGNSQSCSTSFPIWLFSKPHQWHNFCCTQHSRHYHDWKHQLQICCPNNSRRIFCSSDSTWTWDENGGKHDF